ERPRLRRDLRRDRERVLELAAAAGVRRGTLRGPDRAHALQRGPGGRRAGWPALLLRQPAPEPRRRGADALAPLRLLPTEPDAAARLAGPLRRHAGRGWAAGPPVRRR